MKNTIIMCCIIGVLYPGYIHAQGIPQQYREKFPESFPNRKAQHLEIKAYAEKLFDEGVGESLNLFKPDFFSIENYKSSLYPYRKLLADYFGYPPLKSKEGKISKFIKVGEDVNCTVYRVWVEVMDGVTAYGIYMVPKKLKGKAPMIIAQHGGGGNPEAICDLDTRINYHSFGQEAVKRGYIVWAPALVMRSGFSDDPDIPGASREILERKLQFVGTSIIGIEFHKIIESTKALIKERPEIDPSRIGMTGLSYGGFFTMYTAALCPFIKVAVPSGFFKDSERESRDALINETELLPPKSIFSRIGHFQAIGLICPRPCMVQLGKIDRLFDLDDARSEAEKASKYYEKLGIRDKFEFNVHPGGHEFDNENIFRFFDQHL